MEIVTRAVGNALSLAIYLALVCGVLSVLGLLLGASGLFGPSVPSVGHVPAPHHAVISRFLPAFLEGVAFGAKWGALIGAVWGALKGGAALVERNSR